jgi:hypothetical protein
MEVDPEGAKPKLGVLGPWRAISWLAAASWWAVKSPAGLTALGAASVPWLACSLLILPSDGLSMAIGVGFYAQMCMWTALCAGVHFEGKAFEWQAMRAAWVQLASQSRALSLCYALCAACALVWLQLCVSASGIGVLLEQLRSVKPGVDPHDLVSAAWAKDGLDGIALPLLALQIGLGLINGFWCLFPWLAMATPGAGARSQLAKGWALMRSAPFQLWMLGMVGVFIAELSIAVPPLALLSGVWMSACAFAARDLSVGVGKAP